MRVTGALLYQTPAQLSSLKAQKNSGRVGRSAAAKAFDPAAIRLVVVARIRHRHTGYDEILMRTDDRKFARGEVEEQVDNIVHLWEQG